MPHPMRKGLWLAAALTSLLLPRIAAAQVLTGTLTGTVRDEQGMAVAGAEVRVSSPSLIGRVMTVATGERGQWWFPALFPGLYDLEIETPAFAPYPLKAIRIAVGATVELPDIVLKLRSEVVNVIGSGINARNVGFDTSIGPDQLAETPTRRNSFFAHIITAPGVSPTSQATVFVSVFGSGVDQNAYLVDGTNVTATSNGVVRSEPGIDFVQEIHVQSVGASAEYGNVQGAVIDIITRQGGNEFSWDGSYYAQPSALTSQPISRLFNGIDESGYERQRYSDATTTFGGPVARDRAWFFAGYQFLRDEDSQPGADPLYPKRFAQDKVFAKLTWKLAPGWRLVQSIHNESWDNRELPTATKRVEATQRLQASVPAVTFGHLTHTFSSNRLWEISVGRFQFNQDISRVTGDPNTPGRTDRTTSVMTGAPLQLGEVEQRRWTAKTTMSQFRPGLLGADHTFKVGGQVDRGQHRALLFIPTGVRYVDNPPQPSQAITGGPSNAGGLFVTGSAFVTDAVTIGDRLTISAGLRFDHSRATSPDIHRLLADGSDTGETIEGTGLLFTWNVVSPRVGVALKLTPDGRTILRGSYGKFSQGVLTGELSGNHPGMAATTTTDFDPETGTFSKNPIPDDPKTQVQIDPRTSAPRTDTYSIGVDREIGRPLSIGVVYVHKSGRNFIGWEDVTGEYVWDSTRSNPVNGQTLPVKVLTSDPRARLYQLTNPKDYSLDYDGVAVTAEKRRSHGWQASGSYTWSRATGLQPSSGTTAAGAQVATVGAPPVSFSAPVTFGRDPNSLTNAGGRLPNDRPHLFKALGAFDVPKVGTMVAANLQYSSGKPWARTTDLTLSTGQRNVRILLEPRGTKRLSSQTVLDLRVSKAFTVGGVGRVELRADVLNALNDTAEESIQSDRFDSPNFKVGNVFLDPRRVMLSVKVNLGR